MVVPDEEKYVKELWWEESTVTGLQFNGRVLAGQLAVLFELMTLSAWLAGVADVL